MEHWGFLLLSSHLGNPQRRPLTVAQMRTLSQRILAHGPFEAGRTLGEKDLLALGYSREFAGQILSLLEEQELLERYLQKGRARRCIPITRQDARYPAAVRRKLGQDSPGCLRAGGAVISVVADALHSHLETPNVLYLSEEDYDAPFSPLRALRRNRVIHALGGAVLVAQSRAGQGGTWSGTRLNLQHRWTPVYCYDDGSEGAEALFRLGAEKIGKADLTNLSQLLSPQENLFELGTFHH